MNIKLKELYVIQNLEKDICSYKIKDIEYCCNEMRNQEIFDLQYLPPIDCMIDNLGVMVEKNDNYYLIRYCPFCGERINISLIDRKDKSKKYYKYLDKVEVEKDPDRRKTKKWLEKLFKTDSIHKNKRRER